MAISRLYIDGQPWEIMGEVSIDFLSYKAEVEASRSGKPYTKLESKVKKVEVDEVKANPDEFDSIVTFFQNCKAIEGFTATIAVGEDCSDNFREYIFTNCMIMGEPKYSIFERKIDGFEFAYENYTVKESTV